jgi:ribosomal protein S18 acetylase RimI-like enzyme
MVGWTHEEHPRESLAPLAPGRRARLTGADVSARVAWTEDAPAMAAVQVRAWRTSYAGLLPAEVLDGLDQDQIAEGWRLALARPTDARNRVLVALERNLVTGFLVTGPATDPDCDPVATGELADLTVDPHKRGVGHGSRLLQAGADTLVADRFERAVMWLPAADDALRAFLTSGGWGPDGAHRTLDLLGDGTTTLKQVRLHTALVDPS